MSQIRIPPVLRPEAGNNRQVEVDGATVREAIDALVAAFPALAPRLREGDGVPSFLNVFVDGEDIRLLGGLDTPVETASTILLLPAVAGGENDEKAPEAQRSRVRGLGASAVAHVDDRRPDTTEFEVPPTAR